MNKHLFSSIGLLAGLLTAGPIYADQTFTITVVNNTDGNLLLSKGKGYHTSCIDITSPTFTPTSPYLYPCQQVTVSINRHNTQCAASRYQDINVGYDGGPNHEYDTFYDWINSTDIHATYETVVVNGKQSSDGVSITNSDGNFTVTYNPCTGIGNCAPNPSKCPST